MTGFPVPFVEPLKAVGCREAILNDRGLVMTLPRTAGDVLDRHVAFEIESIDRMYCNVYQLRLQHPKAVAGSSGITWASRWPPPRSSHRSARRS